MVQNTLPVSSSPALTSAQVRTFRKTVYNHFATAGRDLPWRHTTDPYHIYVSEIMLQQTQVDRVVDKYESFIARFPTIAALANAPLSEVLSEWQGLGYNRRGLSLWKAANMMVTHFGARVPATPDLLQQLPGIGTATAASIGAFGFNLPVIFIETNIRSVFIHHFFGEQESVSDDQIYPLVAQTLDKKSPCRWYSALMDYGTVLKKMHRNPSRRSRHHVRQSAFEGSRRQLRGALLREVLHAPITIPNASKVLNRAHDEVREIANIMITEGILVLQGQKLTIGPGKHEGAKHES